MVHYCRNTVWWAWVDLALGSLNEKWVDISLCQPRLAFLCAFSDPKRIKEEGAVGWWYSTSCEIGFVIGFSMNRTSRRTSRDNSGQDVLLSSCPGTKIFPCPAISFSRDKGRYKNPGTTPLSQDIPGQNYFPPKTKKQEKDVLKQENDVLKQDKRISEFKSLFASHA